MKSDKNQQYLIVFLNPQIDKMTLRIIPIGLIILNIVVLFAAIPAFNFPVVAQSVNETKVPRFEKRSIAETGCFFYGPQDFPELEKSYSEDGSEVYSGEFMVGNHNFGVIMVKFIPEMTASSPEEMEALMESYMDFLAEQANVPNARGGIDYWEDAGAQQYAVKGWVDTRFLCVLYISGDTEYPVFNVQEIYLNGFRFPEE